MRRGLAILISAGALTGLGVAAGGPASADPPVPCPDSHVQVERDLVPNGVQKDKNGNMLVCAKVQPDGVVGGPDDNDVTDDLIL